MKLTKSKLYQLIKEELASPYYQALDRGGHEGPDWWPEPEEELDDTMSYSMLGELWQDLNELLEQWQDHKHPYYKDLDSLVEKYSTQAPEEKSIASQTGVGEELETAADIRKLREE